MSLDTRTSSLIHVIIGLPDYMKAGPDLGPIRNVHQGLGGFWFSIDMSLTHDMGKIRPLKTTVAPARQVDSTRVEHQYTSRRTLLSKVWTCSRTLMHTQEGNSPVIPGTSYLQGLRHDNGTRKHFHSLGGLVAMHNPTADRVHL